MTAHCLLPVLWAQVPLLRVHLHSDAGCGPPGVRLCDEILSGVHLGIEQRHLYASGLQQPAQVCLRYRADSVCNLGENTAQRRAAAPRPVTKLRFQAFETAPSLLHRSSDDRADLVEACQFPAGVSRDAKAWLREMTCSCRSRSFLSAA